MNVKELEENLQKQIDQIDAAIVKLRHNVLIDVSFIDREVAALCQQIIGADGMAAKMLEPKMLEMINKLDELAVEIKDYQDRMNPEAAK